MDTDESAQGYQYRRLRSRRPARVPKMHRRSVRGCAPSGRFAARHELRDHRRARHHTELRSDLSTMAGRSSGQALPRSDLDGVPRTADTEIDFDAWVCKPWAAR